MQQVVLRPSRRARRSTPRPDRRCHGSTVILEFDYPAVPSHICAVVLVNVLFALVYTFKSFHFFAEARELIRQREVVRVQVCFSILTVVVSPLPKASRTSLLFGFGVGGGGLVGLLGLG